ncbi:polysaccharide lyase family 14 protein [Tulasnella calospora MUT 4182]|uniref:Polysaccharide lyase family 14 protein n=1 Tax=Tulasnella calospora MUT 4182 TaxID=1051891 RepID=A0A0C3QTL1_9AGAM|nr:polysaccharide lyase family 14 protein [Tulasnella calospora MUT 4182]
MQPESDKLLVIVNPASGAKQAVIDVAAFVLPLLKGIKYQLATTEEPGHAGLLAREFIRSGEGSSILVAGGDGTVHEVANALVLHGDEAPTPMTNDLTLVLFPSGTANALYASLYSKVAPNPSHEYLILPDTEAQAAYRLKSVLAFVHSRLSAKGADTPEVQPSRQLSLALTEIQDVTGRVIERLVGIVVNSTSLHAAILHTAEQLRDSIPGLERFKVAAQRNMAQWYTSEVQIFGSDGSTANGVGVYDPARDEIVSLGSQQDGNILTLEGPFSYFLSTVNVDRLEPTFYITAPFTTHAPPDGSKTMEIVVLRPGREPTFPAHAEAAEIDAPERERFGKDVAMKALFAAYDKGSHVGLTYPNGETIVEYYRAGGWEWIPEGNEEASRLVCIDGTVKEVPVGGKARCRVISSDVGGIQNLTVRVYL